jgi:hypothetical protein
MKTIHKLAVTMGLLGAIAISFAGEAEAARTENSKSERVLSATGKEAVKAIERSANQKLSKVQLEKFRDAERAARSFVQTADTSKSVPKRTLLYCGGQAVGLVSSHTCTVIQGERKTY